jgi:hypothetical protein
MKGPGKFLRWLNFGGWVEVQSEEADIGKPFLRPAFAAVALFACTWCFLSVLGYCGLYNVGAHLGIARYIVALGLLWCGGGIALSAFAMQGRQRKKCALRYLAYSVVLLLFCKTVEWILPGRRSAHLLLAGIAAFAGQIWLWRKVCAADARMQRWKFRPRLHFVKIILDVAKVALLLVLVILFLVFLQLATLPFRPLALGPPPDDLLARYLPPETEPMGDGTAERLLQELDEWTRAGSDTTNAAAAAWHQHWERLDDLMMEKDLFDSIPTKRWQDVADEDVDRELDAILSKIVFAADACVGDAPGPEQSGADPLWGAFAGFVPVREGLRLAAVRRVDRADPQAARRAIGRVLDVSVYSSRGGVLDWNCGCIGVRDAVRVTLRLSETGDGLATSQARALEHVWHSAHERLQPIPNALRRAVLGPLARARSTYLYRSDVRRGVYRAIFSGGTPSDIRNALVARPYWDPYPHGASIYPLAALMELAAHSALTGNDRRAVARVSERAAKWQVVRVGAMLDPHGPLLTDLAAVESAVSKTHCYGFKWSRGWIALRSYHPWAFFGSMQSDLWSDCMAARTAVMLAAYRTETGNWAKTLDDLAERLDWTVPKHPLTGQPLDYIRLEAPPEATLGAGGYALASWADGRAIRPGGGRVWLVLRNPAFGGLPFRIYVWSCYGATHGREEGTIENTVRMTETEMTRLWRGKAAPAVEVPASLFRDDPQEWEEAEEQMRYAGWRLD